MPTLPCGPDFGRLFDSRYPQGNLISMSEACRSRAIRVIFKTGRIRMIVVRNVFRLKFGKAREAVAGFKTGLSLMNRQGFGRAPARLLTDVVSTFYTVVLELTFESLTQYEEAAKGQMGNSDWKAWYETVQPFIESGHREIFAVVE
jgi:hypothetical protein